VRQLETFQRKAFDSLRCIGTHSAKECLSALVKKSRRIFYKDFFLLWQRCFVVPRGLNAERLCLY
jgi:hypothetical protein